MSNQKLTLELKQEPSNKLEFFQLENSDEIETVDEMLAYLRQCIKKGNLKKGTVVKDNNFTNYVFDIKGYNSKTEEQTSYQIVVKVNNAEKRYHKATISSLNDFCLLSKKIRQLNRTRIAAGVLASAVLFTTAGPVMARGIKSLIDKEKAYDRERYSQTLQQNSNVPSQERLEHLQAEYYEDLAKRAANGDENAKEEYDQYLMEQEIQQSKSMPR